MGSDPTEGYLPKWHALHNFHGQWYLDSDDLEAIVPHRLQTGDDMIRSNQMLFAKLFANLSPDQIPTPSQRWTFFSVSITS